MDEVKRDKLIKELEDFNNWKPCMKLVCKKSGLSFKTVKKFIETSKDYKKIKFSIKK